MAFPSDLDIAQAATARPIKDLATEHGIQESELEPYGQFKSKVKLDLLSRLKDKPNGRYVDVTAVTPTPLG
jgi:methylenetetrahydrofolate dehydrogenase (NADP+) / methenyltetrahydrofolate cyclohydrolase / formyltetrahydrofolate synthetase